MICANKNVEFEDGSELKIISKYTFSRSDINSIEFPPNVIEIQYMF